MTVNVGQFKRAFKNYARPTHFEVQIAIPTGFAASTQFRFYVKGAQIPNKSIGTVELKFLGRGIKYPGNAVYEPWQTTIYNDEAYTVRNALEIWQEEINSTEGNITPTNPFIYQSEAIVWQLDSAQNRVKQYNFINIWPSIMDPLDLDAEALDTPEEYAITWEYDYWTSDTTR